MANLNNVNPELRARVEWVLATNPMFWIESAYRSSSNQQRLYDLFIAGKGNPANKPGTSKHETGFAVDIACNPLDSIRRAKAIYDAGLYTPYLPKEPWHVELRKDRGPVPELPKQLRKAPPQQPNKEQVFGDEHMRRIDIHVPQLDNAGNGWKTVDVDPDKVVSIIGRGSYPPVDGYWNNPIFNRQNRDGKTVVTITEGTPSGELFFSVWAAD
jgi:hypothetical protein